jgi:hypothetical protein
LGVQKSRIDYAQGQIKYVDLDLSAMTGNFMPKISIPLKPFQGTLGVAPPDGFFPPLSPGVTSSVPPGPHAGNLDLSELSEGSTPFRSGSPARSSMQATAMWCRATRDLPHRAGDAHEGAAHSGDSA